MTKSSGPLVSVIFPMFNVEKTVANSLGTIQDQTYENIEIICVDDGSTDRTVDLVQPFLNDPRIRLVRQENRGLGGARNTGLRESDGDWVTFVDSDDWVLPTMVEKLVAMATAENIDIADCLFTVVDDDGEVMSTRDSVVDRDDKLYFARIMSGQAPAQACARLYRKTLFTENDIAFPEKTIHEDLFTVYKLFFFANSYLTVNEPLYVWHARPGSLSRAISIKHVDDTFSAFEDAWDFLTRHRIRDEYLPQFYRRCAHYAFGVYQKIDKFGSITNNKDEVRTYVAMRINASPFFSSKLLQSLYRTDQGLLRRLAKHDGFRFGSTQGQDVTSFLSGANAAGVATTAPTLDPHLFITFSGILMVIYRKLRRRFGK